MSLHRLLVGACLCAALIAVPGCKRAGSTEVRVHQMGEKVQLGTLAYTVFESEWVTQFGQGPAARIPQHRFFLVRVSIANGASNDVMAPNLSLVDDSGQTIPELNDGEGAPQWIGYLRNIKPLDNATGNILFDAPPRHYRLRLADDTGEKTALVDIPLSFSAPETPEAPLPPAPAKRP